MYFIYCFDVSNTGGIDLHKQIKIFKPQNYDWGFSKHIAIRLILFAFWVLYLLISLIYSLVDLLLRVYNFISKGSDIIIDWLMYMEYGIIVLGLIIIF